MSEIDRRDASETIDDAYQTILAVESTALNELSEIPEFAKKCRDKAKNEWLLAIDKLFAVVNDFERLSPIGLRVSTEELKRTSAAIRDAAHDWIDATADCENLQENIQIEISKIKDAKERVVRAIELFKKQPTEDAVDDAVKAKNNAEFALETLQKICNEEG